MNRLNRSVFPLTAVILAMGCFATSRGQSLQLQDAQGNPISSVTVNAPLNGLAEPQTLKLVSTGGVQALNIAVSLPSAPFPYLRLAPSSGSTPLDFTLTQQIASPGTPVSYQGSLTATPVGSSATLSVPVFFNAGTSPTGRLTLSNATLAFTVQPGQSATQSVTVGSVSGQAEGFTVTTDANWLTATPASGTTGAQNNLTIAANAAALSAGAYTGTVTVAPIAGGAARTIAVTMTVTGAPTLTVTPTVLNLAYQVGQALPAAQSLTLTLSGTAGTTNNYTVSTDAPTWLIVSPASVLLAPGQSGSVVVQAAPQSLVPGQYQGRVTITGPNANVIVTVNLLVSNTALLVVQANPQPFAYQLGGTVPANQTVRITSSSTPVAFTVEDNAQWLAVTPTAGTTPQDLTLQVTPTGLPAGQYAALVTLTPNNGSPSRNFQVVLNVSASALLTSSTSALTFNYQINGSTPQAQALTISSTGVQIGVTPTVTTSTCGAGWLSVSPTSATNTPAQFFVSVTPSSATGNPPQACQGAVTFAGSGSSVSVPVTLNVSTTPLINVSPSSLTFNVQPGGAPASNYLTLTSTDETTPAQFIVGYQTSVGGNWLSAAANNGSTSGSTPANVIVTVNPMGLPNGTYSGTVSITPVANNAQTIQVPIVLNVGTGSSGGAVTPTALAFSLPLNATTASQPQDLAITAPTVTLYNAAIEYSPSLGVEWLQFSTNGTLTPTVSGNTDSTVRVVARAQGLTQGTYNANVVFTLYGTPTQTIRVPVTLTVTAPQTMTVNPASLTFNGTAGSTQNPAGQTVTLTTSNAGATVTATATSTQCGGNWLSVTPGSGTTGTTSPYSTTFTVNSSVSGVSAGTCTGQIRFSSTGSADQVVNVTFTVASAPVPSVTTVQNGASFLPGPISAGELITLRGSNLGPATGVSFALDQNGRVPTTLSDVQVTIDDTPIPLTYVSATQINAIVPYEMAGRFQVAVRVLRNGVPSAPITLSVATTAPGIFTAPNSLQAAALNQDGTYNGVCAGAGCTTVPARKGEIITIYATGEGTVTPLPATGSVTPVAAPYPQLLNGPVTVKVGGVALPASDVTYAGPAPGLVAGALQVNFRIPDYVNPAQPVPVTIEIGGKSSQPVTIAVQ